MNSIEVGNIVTIKRFEFTNKSGGTGMSDCEYNEKYVKPVKVKVIKSWHDYECGYRGHAVSEDAELLKYLKRNAKRGYNDLSDEKLNKMIDDGQYRVYISEFDVIDKFIQRNDELVEALKELMELINTNNLVRNISRDNETKYFLEQGVRINNVLFNCQEALKNNSK